MDNYLELPIGDKAPEVLTAVVDIPEDSTSKDEFNRNMNVFVLDREGAYEVIRSSHERFIHSTVDQ